MALRRIVKGKRNKVQLLAPPPPHHPPVSHNMISNFKTQQPVSSISTSQFADRTRKLIKLVTDLRALGAHADLNLPKIAVIGNQSAGKSSLVEAISRIRVPRASGTCTRCPMECRLTNSNEPWRCQVKLRRERDESGHRLKDIKEVNFGEELTDETRLENVLRRAQLAILNPNVPANQFVDFDLSGYDGRRPPLGSTSQLSFSSNVVCVDVSSNEVTDLSFIDLPGLIGNVGEGEDEGNIDLIKSLVQTSISGNTLILQTISMRDEWENQSAGRHAKEEDKYGLRTIGALTKPDTLQDGEAESWIEVLKGQKHALKYGYYVTKQPDNNELKRNISFEDARANERSYFNKAPWGDLPVDLRARLGTPALIGQLSGLLSSMIDQALPQLRNDARESLEATRETLSGMPLPPSDRPVRELNNLVISFTAAFERFVVGAEGSEALLQSCRASFSSFKLRIASTRPSLSPFTRSEAVPTTATPEFGDRDTDDGFPSRRPSSPVEETKQQWMLTFAVEDEHEEIPWMAKPDPIYIDEIRDRIQKSLTRELPGNIPYTVKKKIVVEAVAGWSRCCNTCFESVFDATKMQLIELANSHFAKYHTEMLFNDVRAVIENELWRLRKKLVAQIEWMLKLEDPPATYNTQYFKACRDRYLAAYREARLGARRIYSRDVVRRALSALAEMGHHVTEAELKKLDVSYDFDDELVIIAEVQAYFRIAYKRIIDLLPRIIDHDFLWRLVQELQLALLDGLKLDEDNAATRARAYLMEDPQLTAERAMLEAKQARLEEAVKALSASNV